MAQEHWNGFLIYCFQLVFLALYINLDLFSSLLQVSANHSSTHPAQWSWWMAYEMLSCGRKVRGKITRRWKLLRDFDPWMDSRYKILTNWEAEWCTFFFCILSRRISNQLMYYSLWNVDKTEVVSFSLNLICIFDFEQKYLDCFSGFIPNK